MVEVVAGIRVECEIGRPIDRLREIYADPAYDSMRIKVILKARRYKVNTIVNPTSRPKPNPGRLP
jgi:hypothetical protein